MFLSMFDPTANLVCLLVIAHLVTGMHTTYWVGLIQLDHDTISIWTDSPNMTHLTTQPLLVGGFNPSEKY